MRPGLTTPRLVDELGPALLRIAVPGAASDRPLTGVVIHDRAHDGDLEPGSLVLGIGVAGREELAELARIADEAGAGAVAVKAPVPDGLGAVGVPIVEVRAEASWMHVAATVRQRLLDHSRSVLDPVLDPVGATGDLFTIANAIGGMLRAPITIEDRSSSVLAWSGGQDETDEARVQTILGRAVHQRWLDELAARGVFAKLHAGTEPVYVEPVAPGILPRAAIAVRAGAEVLGYVWAAIPGPLTPELARSLEQVAPIVALHLANLRADTTWARRQRGELAAAVLAGGAAGADAARALRLDSGPLCVLAGALRTAEGSAAAVALASRFSDALELYLASVHPSAVVVPGTDTVLALVGWPRAGAREALDSCRALARDFVHRSPAGEKYLIAIGGPVGSAGAVPEARVQAEAALRALRHDGARSSRSSSSPVATLAEVALPVLLLHLADVTSAVGLPPLTGPLRTLADHDGEDGVLTRTLAAYFAAAGVAEDAATALRIHVNTLRYRLRRIKDICGLDFTDADAILLAQLQLRLRALGAGDKAHPRSSS